MTKKALALKGLIKMINLSQGEISLLARDDSFDVT